MEDPQEFLGLAQQTGGRFPRKTHGSLMRQDYNLMEVLSWDTQCWSVGHPWGFHGPSVGSNVRRGLPLDFQVFAVLPLGTPMCL